MSWIAKTATLAAAFSLGVSLVLWPLEQWLDIEPPARFVLGLVIGVGTGRCVWAWADQRRRRGR